MLVLLLLLLLTWGLGGPLKNCQYYGPICPIFLVQLQYHITENLKTMLVLMRLCTSRELASISYGKWGLPAMDIGFLAAMMMAAVLLRPSLGLRSSSFVKPLALALLDPC